MTDFIHSACIAIFVTTMALLGLGVINAVSVALGYGMVIDAVPLPIIGVTFWAILLLDMAVMHVRTDTDCPRNGQTRITEYQ